MRVPDKIAPRSGISFGLEYAYQYLCVLRTDRAQRIHRFWVVFEKDTGVVMWGVECLKKHRNINGWCNCSDFAAKQCLSINGALRVDVAAIDGTE